MDDLKKLMGHIAKVWECGVERYPALRNMGPNERRNFLVNHSLLHVTKTLGKLAAACEDYDHKGSSASRVQEAEDAAIRLFVNSLKLAQEAGLTAEDLLTRAPSFVK
jgi:hypothetical protein